MSLHLTLSTPRYHNWCLIPRVWFYQPDEHSSGGTGFQVPFLQVCFMWGHR